MAYMWAVTIGFLLCLGFLSGGFLYVLKRSLKIEDSKRIDPLKRNDT
ncbi:hypothetical protein [Peribacillus sp. SCS-155]